ncbi:GPR1/FUN34/yaaH family [Mycobacteroides abscessus subsp. abscessus]|nr:GPR1/FUN34/yaaH family [Mycobacteroides abscessus subsp. abscessus]
MDGDPKQLGFAFVGYLIFSLFMTVGAMETHKVLFFIFVFIDFLFIGLSLSTFGIMHEATHMLAAVAEMCIALLSFYGSCCQSASHSGFLNKKRVPGIGSNPVPGTFFI